MPLLYYLHGQAQLGRSFFNAQGTISVKYRDETSQTRNGCDGSSARVAVLYSVLLLDGWIGCYIEYTHKICWYITLSGWNTIDQITSLLFCMESFHSSIHCAVLVCRGLRENEVERTGKAEIMFTWQRRGGWHVMVTASDMFKGALLEHWLYP